MDRQARYKSIITWLLLLVMITTSPGLVPSSLAAPPPAQNQPVHQSTHQDIGLAQSARCESPNEPPSGTLNRLTASNEILVAYRQEIDGRLRTLKLNNRLGGNPGQLDITSIGRHNYHWFNGDRIFRDIKEVAVAAGDMDGDRRDEVFMAYRGDDDTLDMLTMYAAESYTDPSTVRWNLPSSSDVHRIDVAMAEHRGVLADGTGRIIGSFDESRQIPVIAYVDVNGLDAVRMMAINPNRSISQPVMVGPVVVDNIGSGRSRDDVAIATGDLTGIGYNRDIVTVHISKDRGNPLRVSVYRLFTLPAVFNLVSLFLPIATADVEGYRQIAPTNADFDVTLGDLDGDRRDEIIVVNRNNGRTLFATTLRYNQQTRSLESQYQWESVGSENFRRSGSRVRFLSVEAADTDGDALDEIVIGLRDDFSDAHVVLLEEGVTRTRGVPIPGLIRRGSWTDAGQNRFDVEWTSVAVGDLDFDNRAEVVLAFEDAGDDLQVVVLDDVVEQQVPIGTEQNGLVLRDTLIQLQERNLGRAYTSVVVGDLDGETSYAEYTNRCQRVEEARVTSVVFQPPRWPEAQDFADVRYGLRESRTESENQTSINEHGASVSLVVGASDPADIVELEQAFTFEFSESLAESMESGVEEATVQAELTTASGLVGIDEVTYDCYEYRDTRRNRPAPLVACIPVSTDRIWMSLDLWNDRTRPQGGFRRYGDEWFEIRRPWTNIPPEQIAVDDFARDIQERNGQLLICLDERCQRTVPINGQLIWSWDDSRSPFTVTYAFPGTLMQTFGEMSRDLFRATARTESIGYTFGTSFQFRLFGSGFDAGTTLGIGQEETFTQSFANGLYVYWANNAIPLPEDPNDPVAVSSYSYVPYLYEQTTVVERNGGRAEHGYVVFDYYVDNIDTTTSPGAGLPITGITPQNPVIGVPGYQLVPGITFPFPLPAGGSNSATAEANSETSAAPSSNDQPIFDPETTWIVSDTVTFVWQQPEDDPSNVIGAYWHIDQQPHTVPAELGRAPNDITSYTFDPPADGVYYLHVQSMGDNGEAGPASHLRFQVDNTPPQVDLQLDSDAPPGHNGWYVAPLTATLAISDGTGSGIAQVATSTDGGQTFQPYDTPAQPLRFTEDTLSTTLVVSATDVAGLTSRVTETFRIDTTPPTSEPYGLAFKEVTLDEAGNPMLALGGAADDAISGLATMQLRFSDDPDAPWLDASEIGSFSLPENPDETINWRFLSQDEIGRGYYQVYGRAVDQAGNVEPAYLLGEVRWEPDNVPDLSGSRVIVSPQQVRPGETVTYTVELYNTGMQEIELETAWQLPAGMVLSDTFGMDEESATQSTLLWPAEWQRHTFVAYVAEDVPAGTLESLLTITGSWPGITDVSRPGEANQFVEQRPVSIQVVPTLADEDRKAAFVASIDVLEGEVTDDRNVTLAIFANETATEMDIREFVWDTVDERWQLAQQTGFVPIVDEYPFTLTDTDGVHYLYIQIRDANGTISAFDESSFTHINLFGTTRTLRDGERVPYRINLISGEALSMTLQSLTGDADLYLWKPQNPNRPNGFAEGNAPTERLVYSVPIDGVYHIEVIGRGDSQYILDIDDSLETEQVGPTDNPAQQGKARPAALHNLTTPLNAGATTMPGPTPTPIDTCQLLTAEVHAVGMSGQEAATIDTLPGAPSHTVLQLAGAAYGTGDHLPAAVTFSVDGTTITPLLPALPPGNPFSFTDALHTWRAPGDGTFYRWRGKSGYRVEVAAEDVASATVQLSDPDQTARSFVAYSLHPTEHGVRSNAVMTTTLGYAWGGSLGRGQVGPARLVLPLPEPLQSTTAITVQVVVMDKDHQQGADQRQAIVEAEAGGVRNQVILTNPQQEHVNIVEVLLEAVPAGTDAVAITLISPEPAAGGSQWNNPAAGDSVFLLGATAQHLCAPVPTAMTASMSQPMTTDTPVPTATETPLPTATATVFAQRQSQPRRDEQRVFLPMVLHTGA